MPEADDTDSLDTVLLSQRQCHSHPHWILADGQALDHGSMRGQDPGLAIFWGKVHVLPQVTSRGRLSSSIPHLLLGVCSYLFYSDRQTAQR